MNEEQLENARDDYLRGAAAGMEHAEIEEENVVRVPILAEGIEDTGHALYMDKRLLVGRPRHLDGWSTMEVLPSVDTGGVELPAGLVPWVQLDFPDYPSEDAVSYLVLAEDAIRIGRMLIQTAESSIRAAKHHQHRLKRIVTDASRAEMLQKQAEQMSCSVEGCRKQRHFFDSDGRGYCKRHAEERGLRPKGKIA